MINHRRIIIEISHNFPIFLDFFYISLHEYWSFWVVISMGTDWKCIILVCFIFLSTFWYFIFSPFFHHRHMHEIAYVSKWYLKSLKIAISISFNEFWRDLGWYGIVWWLIGCSKWSHCVDPLYVNWCHVFIIVVIFEH